MIQKYFLVFCGVLFLFFTVLIMPFAQSFIFLYSPVYLFFLLLPVRLVSFKKSIAKSSVVKLFSVFSFERKKSFRVLFLMFRSLIHFELIFVGNVK